MADIDTLPPGSFCWPELATSDQKAGTAFYVKLFDWKQNDQDMGPAGVYSMFQLRGRDVAAGASLRPEEKQHGVPPHWNTYISVANADAAVKRAQELGAKILAPAFDVMDAGRMAVLADPEGAVFCVWQPKQHKGARIVNEHGSLNFNGLATRDPEQAKAFYGAVFGWTTLALPAGLMWTLPGYGDHLEEATPGLREQMAQMGGPEGFIDVVAALNPIAADDSTTSPHWSVTFGVDNADAIAAKAQELRGEVVAGPVDAPWTRMAVIKDPQGATFVASQFVAENKDLEA